MIHPVSGQNFIQAGDIFAVNHSTPRDELNRAGQITGVCEHAAAVEAPCAGF